MLRFTETDARSRTASNFQVLSEQLSGGEMLFIPSNWREGGALLIWPEKTQKHENLWPGLAKFTRNFNPES